MNKKIKNVGDLHACCKLKVTFKGITAFRPVLNSGVVYVNPKLLPRQEAARLLDPEFDHLFWRQYERWEIMAGILASHVANNGFSRHQREQVVHRTVIPKVGLHDGQGPFPIRSQQLLELLGRYVSLYTNPHYPDEFGPTWLENGIYGVERGEWSSEESLIRLEDECLSGGDETVGYRAWRDGVIPQTILDIWMLAHRDKGLARLFFGRNPKEMVRDRSYRTSIPVDSYAGGSAVCVGAYRMEVEGFEPSGTPWILHSQGGVRVRFTKK